jgi:hypothetical protein
LISGFRRDEICAVMAYYGAFTDVSGQCIGPIFKGQEVPLKMGTKRCPEMSVKDYHSTLHNMPEERQISSWFFLIS